MIVALEGVDGSGKTKHSKLLAEENGWHRLGFPDRTTPMGKLISSHLKGFWSARELPEQRQPSVEDQQPWPADAMVFQALQTVNRLELLPHFNTLARLGNVILDRYWASGVVYGTLDGLEPGYLRALHASLPQPALTVLLDIDVAHALQRRAEKLETYEKDPSVRERLIDGYRQLWARAQTEGWPGRWVVVDGRDEFDVVHARILGAIYNP